MGEQVYMPRDFLSTTPSPSSLIVHNILSCFERNQLTMISHLMSLSSPPSWYRELASEVCPVMGGGIVGVDAVTKGIRDLLADCWGENSDISAIGDECN
jgi:hypothetical protein